MSRIAIAQHWLHFCPSWKSFPKVTRSTLNDACRYFTRTTLIGGRFTASYLLPEGNNLGHICLHWGKTQVILHGASPKELLTKAQDWAEKIVAEANKAET